MSARHGADVCSEYTLPLETVKEWSDFDHMDDPRLFQGTKVPAAGPAEGVHAPQVGVRRGGIIRAIIR